MLLKDFTTTLTDMLDIRRFDGADIALNGLQVGDPGAEVHKVAFAVDTSLATIRKAVEQKADVLFAHHGIFWGKPIAITGHHFDRVSTMIRNNLALFACHLPLDAHPVLGNNAQMASRLGLQDIEPFSFFRGVHVGVKGRLPGPLTAREITGLLGVRENATNFQVNCGDRKFSKVGIDSGDGAGDVYDAMSEGLDLLITGESRYTTVNDCLEDGIGMLCLGHYETETFGVKAVMETVRRDLGLEVCFIDMPLGL
jgi:dinuclear metal center YbgI/SA1388 family protein